MKQGNCIDEVALILLGGELENNKERAQQIAMSKIKDLKDINMTGKQGRTFLMHCCLYDYYDLAVIAVEKGAIINIQDDDGYSPLHDAVRSGDTALVKLLLEKGALTNLTNKYGNNPAYDAIQDWNILKLLLDYGCDIEHENIGGVSPYAIVQSSSEMVKRLHDYRKGYTTA